MPTQAQSLLHDLKQTKRVIGFYMDTDKTEFMHFKKEIPNLLFKW